MTLTERAAKIAVTAHREQVRKSDGSPYAVHPIMCAMLLARHGFSDEVLAAALAHDVLEDTRVGEEELRRELGDAVVDMVCAVSEDKTVDWQTVENGWEQRKQAYIETVRHGSDAVKAVSIADKIHNAQSLLDAYALQGPALWEKFNRGRDAKLWFEENLLAMFRETWQHPLVDEYEALVIQMRTLQK